MRKDRTPSIHSEPGPSPQLALSELSWEKMVKGGCWDIPRVYVGCYGFDVVAQCFFLTFDVLCGGGIGTFFLKSVLSLFGFGLNGGRICLDCWSFMFVFG